VSLPAGPCRSALTSLSTTTAVAHFLLVLGFDHTACALRDPHKDTNLKLVSVNADLKTLVPQIGLLGQNINIAILRTVPDLLRGLPRLSTSNGSAIPPKDIAKYCTLLVRFGLIVNVPGTLAVV
jgi:hypothetical protein